MPRRKKSDPRMPGLWFNGATVGELEALAGVKDRAEFWRPFAAKEHGFVDGIEALKAMINRDFVPVLEAMKTRDAVPGVHGWRKDLSDGTYALLSFGEKARIAGDALAHDWNVDHYQADGDCIGGGSGWDFAEALQSLDGYIANPGWDRAPAPPKSDAPEVAAP